MADPNVKLPPGLKLDIAPGGLKLPPGMQADYNPTQPDWDEYDRKHAGPEHEQGFGGHVRGFASRLFEDAGNLIPGTARLMKNAVTQNPLKTGAQVLEGIGGTVVDPIIDLKNGDYGSAAARVAELGAPLAGKYIGKGVEAGAEPMAAVAGRVRATDRLFDANPERAALTQTKPLTLSPKTIAKELQNKSADIGQRLAQNASTSIMSADLTPTVGALDQRLMRHMGTGATAITEGIQPIRDYLAGEAPPGFAGQTYTLANGRKMISPTQWPDQLLRMTQDFTPNFQMHWAGKDPGAMEQIARETYHNLSGELKRTVPEAAELQPQQHDIISAHKRWEDTARNATPYQRIMGRIAAPTGALVGAWGGAHALGMNPVLGAAIGLTVPELLSSPTWQMGLAKSMKGLGGAMQKPLVTIPATLGAKVVNNQP